jgi:hypothetical protein
MSTVFFLLAFVLGSPQDGRPTDNQIRVAQQKANEYRVNAMHLNDLAGHVTSEADAVVYVNAVAKVFEDELPPSWLTASVRRRVARAEYESVKDRSRLVPEQRIADVWNEYIREIGAPDEARVNAAEIHNLRDAQYTFGQMLWLSDTNRSMWTIPNAVAISADGKVANGCRALEAVRVIVEMDHMFDNVRSARERVRQGIVLSEQIKKQNDNRTQARTSRVEMKVSHDTDPIRPAERRYLEEHGTARFDLLLLRLFDQLFPE